MLTREDIEGFLDRLTAEGASYDEVEQGLWVVRPGGNLELDVVVHYSPPVVLLRVKVMNIPEDDGRCADLNRRLLELNASDLLHADADFLISEAETALCRAKTAGCNRAELNTSAENIQADYMVG